VLGALQTFVHFGGRRVDVGFQAPADCDQNAFGFVAGMTSALSFWLLGPLGLSFSLPLCWRQIPGQDLPDPCPGYPVVLPQFLVGLVLAFTADHRSNSGDQILGVNFSFGQTDHLHRSHDNIAEKTTPVNQRIDN